MRSMVTDPTRPIWMLAPTSPEALAVVPTATPPLLLEVVLVVVVVLVDVLLVARSPLPEVLTATEGDGA